MLVEELIEKAFSDGYEYALMEQKEFASIRQATKIAKRSTKAVFNNIREGKPVFEGATGRITQLNRVGYKIPTEKALDRVASVQLNTVAKMSPKNKRQEIIQNFGGIKKDMTKGVKDLAISQHSNAMKQGFKTQKFPKDFS